jgi:endonuclease/exonuclease/phosphatase (EEP) superfamily protein YafD
MILLLRWLLCSVVWLLATAVSLATLSQAVVWLNWRLQLLEHFRIQYSLVLLLAIPLFWLGHRWLGISKPLGRGWATFWSAVLLLNLWFLLPLYLPAGPAIAQNSESQTPAAQSANTAPGDRLQILFATLDHTNPQLDPQIRHLDQKRADLLYILEVTHSNLPQLRQQLTQYDLVYANPRSNSHGIALWQHHNSLEKVQVQESQIVHLPEDNRTREMVQTRFVAAGQTFDFLCFHAARPSFAGAIAQHQLEILAIADWAQQHPNAIVVGDFNSTPWSRAFRAMLRTSGLRNSQQGFGLASTWNTEFPRGLRIPIDHALHSADLRTVDRQVLPNIGSDHLPIWVEFQLPKAAA